MKPSTILFISHSSQGDGAEICLFRLLATIDRERFRPVLVMPGGGRMVGLAKDLKIPTYQCRVDWWIRADPAYRMSRLDLKSTVAGIMDVIERERPVIVHTNTSVVLSGALAARQSGVRHIWHLHELLGEHTSLRAVLSLADVNRIIGDLSDRIVTVARAQRSALSAVDRGHILTIPNGAPANPFTAAERLATRRELGLESSLIIATVGSVTASKGIGDLIASAAVMKQMGLDAAHIVIGTGEEAELQRIRLEAAHLGVADRIHFLGFRADVPALLAASDILLHPSHNEALPTVVLEAMAAGIPTVVTDSGGTSELVVDGVTGSLVPVRDPERIAASIEILARDEGLRRRMGELGRRRFLEHYSLEAMTRAFEELYRDVIRESAGSPPRPIHPSVQRLVRLYEQTYRRKRAVVRIREMAVRRLGGSQRKRGE
jgi:glycosyltransferase involved in cell wall biosynthesis